jgi:hypothetical protein
MYSLEISIRLVRPDNTTSAPLKLRMPRWIEQLWLKLDPLGLAIWITSPKEFRRGSRFYSQQRYGECISTLEPLTRGEKAYPPALFRRGLAESKFERWSSAHAFISAATKRWPWRRRWLKHLHRIEPLHQLEDYRPEVILYLSGASGCAYQGNMWIPVLERLDAKIAIVARERHIVSNLIPTKLPIFYMTSMRELEFLEKAGVRSVLYPANPQKNTQMLRFYRMTHFFINHGESDKVVNQSKFLMAYDKLLVAGPLAEQRLQDAGIPMRPGQVVHVGRPPVELLLKRVAQVNRPIRRILYAPTWEGFVEEANYSSVSEFGLNLLQSLVAANRWEIIFKAHPFTGSRKTANKQALSDLNELFKSRITVTEPTSSIYELMNDADLMITDISSTIPDYLYTLKPMILTNPAGLSRNEMHATYPSSRATYILDDPQSAAQMVKAIAENDTMISDRQSIARLILGDKPDQSIATFNRIINESLATPCDPGARPSRMASGVGK